MSSVFFNKVNFSFVVLMCFMPAVRDVLSIGNIHPYIAEGDGQRHIKKIIPIIQRGLQEHDPTKYAEVVKNLVPIAKAHIACSSLVGGHGVFENQSCPIVVLYHRCVSVALGNDVNHH